MQNQDKASKPGFNFFYLILMVWLVIFARGIITAQNESETIPYSQFLTSLDQKKIKSVQIIGDHIEGQWVSPEKNHPARFASIRIDDRSLPERLEKSGVTFEGVREITFFRDFLSWTLPLIFMLVFWWFISGRMSQTQGKLMGMGKANVKVYVEHDLPIRFADVAGIDEAKAELQEVVTFLRDPSKFNRLGGRMPKGLLLVGPPGTGKTLLARAVAGEANVPFLSINGSEFVEMFVGLGAARVRDLFEQARASKPCIIFIDELDALGKARGLGMISGGTNDEKEQTLNQLLAELDGFDPSQGIILLAATNRPEILDAALLRSGRFDRQVVIDKPDRKGRADILKIHLKKIQIASSVDADVLASLTAGFSGADLANLVNEAAIIATRRNATTVDQPDFTAGIERIVGGLERKSRVLSPDEKRRVAFHEMGHATLSFEFEHGETVHKVSIIPRGIGALGYTMRRPTEDRYLISKTELEHKLSVLLGGRASEEFFLKDISTGAADDLDKATDIARAMITRYGMGTELGLLTYDRESAPLLNAQLMVKSHDYSEHTAQLIDDESKQLIDRAFTLAFDTIRQNRPFIEKCVEQLLVKETLDEGELKMFWALNHPRSDSQLTQSLG